MRVIQVLLVVGLVLGCRTPQPATPVVQPPANPAAAKPPVFFTSSEAVVLSDQQIQGFEVMGTIHRLESQTAPPHLMAQADDVIEGFFVGNVSGKTQKDLGNGYVEIKFKGELEVVKRGETPPGVVFSADVHCVLPAAGKPQLQPVQVTFALPEVHFPDQEIAHLFNGCFLLAKLKDPKVKSDWHTLKAYFELP